MIYVYDKVDELRFLFQLLCMIIRQFAWDESTVKFCEYKMKNSLGVNVILSHEFDFLKILFCQFFKNIMKENLCIRKVKHILWILLRKSCRLFKEHEDVISFDVIYFPDITNPLFFFSYTKNQPILNISSQILCVSLRCLLVRLMSLPSVKVP
jgi:hypothetical protein